MSIITAQVTNKYYYKNPVFEYLVNPKNSSTNITATFFADSVMTGTMPRTISLLKKNIPSILRSKCFNESNLPFSKEVQDTELGHLFEHILLEYICELKIDLGVSNPVHNGLTKWNWNIEKKGVFHITIDIGTEDKDILQLALHKTSNLTEEIILSSMTIETPLNPFRKEFLQIPINKE